MVASIIDTLCTFHNQVDDETRANEERQRINELVDHGVGDIRVFGPDIAFGEDAAEIATPSVTGPSEDLLDEAPVGFHGTEQLCFFAHLHISVPAVRDHPACKELVVSRVEVIFPQPEVVREAVEKLRIFEDDCPVRCCPTRQTGDTAINVRRRRNLNVSNRETECSERFPNSHFWSARLDALRRPDASDLLIFKARKHVRQQRRRPDCVVVRKHNDIRRGVPDPMRHLQTLVGERHSEHSNFGWVHGVSELLQWSSHPVFCHDDDFFRVPFEP